MGAQQEADFHAKTWQPGMAPVAVIMISLNEGHNMAEVCRNLAGWAQEVFLVDSFSRDDTVDIALGHGVHVVQRRFRDYGDQWNFALRELPIQAPWTMKLDPDERLSPALKDNIHAAIGKNDADGFTLTRRLWLMGHELPVRQRIVRVWRTGAGRFTEVRVNEYPIVDGTLADVPGEIMHLDSPDLDHWLEKQNRYTTAEAIIAYENSALADRPSLLGSPLQRRMWLKKNFHRVPFRYLLMFLYCWIWQGAWRAGWVGYVWSRLRADYMRFIDLKRREIQLTGKLPAKHYYGPGAPDPRVHQFDSALPRCIRSLLKHPWRSNSEEI